MLSYAALGGTLRLLKTLLTFLATDMANLPFLVRFMAFVVDTVLVAFMTFMAFVVAPFFFAVAPFFFGVTRLMTFTFFMAFMGIGDNGSCCSGGFRGGMHACAFGARERLDQNGD